MPTYIVLHELSGENIGSMGEDIEEGKETLEALGCELQGLYLTFGQYDAVGIIDAPDAETAAQFVLTLAKENEVDTETLRAFSEDETQEILAGLPE